MDAKLLEKALEIIPSREILISLVGQRVAELSAKRPKHDPDLPPLPASKEINDVLQEIIDGKITYQ